MYSILVVDDNESIRDLLSEFLNSHGFEVTGASDGQAGLDLMKQQRFDLFFVDLVMPGMGGLDVLREVKALQINIPSIVITAFGSISTTVEAMRLGAFDYITKPFNLDELLIIVNRVLDLQRLQKENATLKKQLKEKFNFRKVIGNSPRMQSLYRIIEKISDTDSTVLISGESGTGKELVAKTIHFNSSRVSNPFVPINCGAIPKDLVESELFGHEKGAFTGAISTRVGRFELANGGTIFLDEIGELPYPLQVKLLRVVQEREFERVGGTRTIKVDVRILAATNRDLKEAVNEGKFREDLYYRLNVIPIQIPPLRERDDDVLLLLDHFLHEFARKKKKAPLKVSTDASRLMRGYDWPGNVRELENAVERMIILNERGMIEVDDLPEHIQSNGGNGRGTLKAVAQTIPGGFQVESLWKESGIDLNGTIDMFERSLIIHALQQSGGVKNKAAALLGLNRTTLTEKIKKKGLMAPSNVS
ncbi:MAG: sigma-54-dependent Fis family transcriptional regulator [Deltaproteobacteria bacterium]|nr:sigma-54-dependent Fis family transcriptional regulator [Deltaproteobacteria bacterium]